jgi:hypothetical protein
VPDYDPFDATAREQSGMNELVEALKPTGLRDPLHTVLTLPANQVDAALADRVREAVTRYCRARIAENRNELASLRWQGLKSLQTGVLFLGLCLFLSAAVDGAEVIPDSLRRLGSEGFLIAGWVSMWHPAELLLYAWWPYWRQIRVYQHIMNMEMSVLARAVEPVAEG